MSEDSPGILPPRSILLATDLSARCDRALDRAAALAGAWGAELVAVHALEQADDFYDTMLERRLPSWTRATDPTGIAVAQLEHDILRSGARISAVVEKGDPADLVLRVARARAGSLIVTGVGRDETLGRFGLGSTVDRLLKRSRVPLLVVRQRYRVPYRSILVASDLSDSSRCALETALAFFPDCDPSLLHAYQRPLAGLAAPAGPEDGFRAAVLAECRAFLAAAGLPEHRRRRIALHAEEGEPVRLIQQFVRDRGTDLVVVATHGKSALFDILLGSVTREMLARLTCDLLVVREPRSRVEGEA